MQGVLKSVTGVRRKDCWVSYGTSLSARDVAVMKKERVVGEKYSISGYEENADITFVNVIAFTQHLIDFVSLLSCKHNIELPT
jgi:hypothetical protein